MANPGVVNVPTVVENKVANTKSEKRTTVENNSRCSERAHVTSLDSQSSELSEEEQEENEHKENKEKTKNL